MKASDIRELNDQQLSERLTSFRQELFNLRFQHSTAQLENTQRLKDVRKNIARILTVQNERAQGN